MKMIMAIIQPFKLDEATRALARIPQFPGVTVTPARGLGGEQLSGGGGLADLDYFVDKVRVEVVVDDELVEPVIEAIARAAQTGRDGDGFVFIAPVERSISIATWERAS